jgi:hypothetical protein
MKITKRQFIRMQVFAALLVCLPTDATTLESMSVARMGRAAPVIIRAQCLASSTGWDAGEIWTLTLFETQEIWKGVAPPRVTVRLIGGRLGNLNSSVPGVPRFKPGEEVVLFLEPTPRRDFSIVSWVQGTFRIHRDPRTGEERITQDTAAFPTFDPRTRRFETSGVRLWPLDKLRAEVAAALSNGPGKKP